MNCTLGFIVRNFLVSEKLFGKKSCFFYEKKVFLNFLLGKIGFMVWKFDWFFSFADSVYLERSSRRDTFETFNIVQIKDFHRVSGEKMEKRSNRAYVLYKTRGKARERDRVERAASFKLILSKPRNATLKYLSIRRQRSNPTGAAPCYV